MHDLKKLAHAVWDCKYHLVWCPKYGFQILKGDVGKSMREIVRELCGQKDVEILEGNVQVITFLWWYRSRLKYSVAYVVGFLKGKSAIAIFDRYRQLKRRHWGRHFWARGYCVGTVGLNEEQIRKYVRWQIKRTKSWISPICFKTNHDPFGVTQPCHRLCRWSLTARHSRGIPSHYVKPSIP